MGIFRFLQREFAVPSADIRVAAGTPVVVKGHKESACLNGKIGDVRAVDEAKECFIVHFEDKGLEPCSVKHEFLRILFELPSNE